MPEKLVDLASRFLLGPRAFQALASLCAGTTLVALFGPATASSGEGQPDGLDSSPLGALFQLLRFMEIPHLWLSSVSEYLAASPARTGVFLFVALLLGFAVAFGVSPTSFAIPSLQASCWWVCLAVATQCGGAIGMMVLSLTGLTLHAGMGAIRQETSRSEAFMRALGLDALHLDAAALYIPLLPVVWVFSRSGELGVRG